MSNVKYKLTVGQQSVILDNPKILFGGDEDDVREYAPKKLNKMYITDGEDTIASLELVHVLNDGETEEK